MSSLQLAMSAVGVIHDSLCQREVGRDWQTSGAGVFGLASLLVTVQRKDSIDVYQAVSRAKTIAIDL